MTKTLNSKFYILIAILIIAAFFRLYNISGLPPGLYPDEAMNGNNALEAISTGGYRIFYPENNGREGLFMNIQAMFLKTLMPLFNNAPEPWMLRLASAFFGILTVLGVYFLAKELFRDEAPNYKHQITNNDKNLNDQNQKRFGILNFKNWNLFGIWNLGFEISRSQKIALLSSFFLATSFWHINFSRIGFRAIMAPFFLIWAVYFLIISLKANSYKLKAIAGGIFFGLGFYSYIAYRVMPLLILIIILYYWFKNKELQVRKKVLHSTFFFLLATFIVALPIGIYFLQNPADFMGRTTQVSVGVSQSPFKDLAENTIKTLGMFNFSGDWNWRHNLAGAPELFLPVGILFVIGIILGIICLSKSQITSTKSQTISNNQISNDQNVSNLEFRILNLFGNCNLGFVILFSWFVLAMLPVVISNEGIPHALRSILLIPPAIIFAGFGGIWLYEFIITKIQNYTKVRKLFYFTCLIFVVALMVQAYYSYFIQWGKNPNVQGAFSADYVQIGKELNYLPKETPKYVIVQAGGTDVRGIPMPSQTVMFITDTFTPEKQKEKNIFYVLPDQISQIPQNAYRLVIK